MLAGREEVVKERVKRVEDLRGEVQVLVEKWKGLRMHFLQRNEEVGVSRRCRCWWRR